MPVATPVAIGDILEVVSNCHCQGQDGDNVTFWEVTARSGTGSPMELVAQDLGTAIGTLLAPMISSLATFRGVLVNRVWPLPRSYQVPLSGTAATGILAGKLLPTQCRGLITRFNTSGGPQNRGRLFVPFSTVDQLSADGGVTAGYITLMDDLASLYSVPFLSGSGGNTTTLTPRLLTRSAVPLSSGLHRIDFWHSNSEYATQRRSGQFGRPNP